MKLKALSRTHLWDRMRNQLLSQQVYELLEPRLPPHEVPLMDPLEESAGGQVWTEMWNQLLTQWWNKLSTKRPR